MCESPGDWGAIQGALMCPSLVRRNGSITSGLRGRSLLPQSVVPEENLKMAINPPDSTLKSARASGRDVPFTVQLPGRRRRTLEIGNTLTRTRKLSPGDPPYDWAIVRDVITAPPAADTSVYVVALCEGIGEHSGEWFIYRTYFTNNRHGKLHFGEKSPQVPITIDRWISEQIVERRWYENISTQRPPSEPKTT